MTNRLVHSYYSESQSNLIVCDPSEEEELNALGYLILGTNNFKEVTAIHITGKSQIIKNVVLKCCTMAWERTNYLMEFVKKSLEDDKLLRTDKNLQNNEVGFVPLIKSSCSNLFTYRKQTKQIEIDETETKDTGKEIEFGNAYLTKMYRFKNNTQAISQEDEVRSNWKNGCNDNDDLVMLDEEDESDNDVQVIE